MSFEQIVSKLRDVAAPCDDCPNRLRCLACRMSCEVYGRFVGIDEDRPPLGSGDLLPPRIPNRRMYRRIFIEPAERELDALERIPAAARTAAEEEAIDHALGLLLRESETLAPLG